MPLLKGPPCPGVALHVHCYCGITARAVPAQHLAEVPKVHHLEGAKGLLWEPQFM